MRNNKQDKKWIKGIVRGNYQLSYFYASKGRLKDYALLLTLKSKHRNSTYYNFSINRVANELKVSYYYLKSALSRLEKDGALRYHNGNLTIIKQKKLSDSLEIDNLKVFEVDARCYTLKEVLSQVRRYLVASTHNRSEWRNNPRNDDNTTESRNAPSENWYERFSKEYVQISYLGLAKLWGCSVGTAFNQIKDWCGKQELKKERCEKVFPDLDSYVVQEARNEGDTSFYLNSRGQVCKVMPNKYLFNI